MSFFLYILHSSSADKFYTGISQNPYTRLSFHNSSEKGFTARYRPWKIVFIKNFYSKVEATLAEKKIKAWKSKSMIQRVIVGQIQI